MTIVPGLLADDELSGCSCTGIDAGIERQGHGGHEEAGLSVEVVVDEGRVHLGLPGHGPQACPVVALGGEDALGRLDDLALGVDVARPAAGRSGGGTHTKDPPEGKRFPRRGIHQRGILC